MCAPVCWVTQKTRKRLRSGDKRIKPRILDILSCYLIMAQTNRNDGNNQKNGYGREPVAGAWIRGRRNVIDHLQLARQLKPDQHFCHPLATASPNSDL